MAVAEMSSPFCTEESWAPIMEHILLVKFDMVLSCVVTEPFVYTISDFNRTQDDSISLTMEFSSVSKIVCAANLSTLLPSELDFPESKQTRYYVRSKKQETHDFVIKYIPDVEQRVFCKVVGLLYDPYVVRYYSSDAFFLSCALAPWF